MNDKLIQIGGKSYKECEVVMLPVAKSKLVLVEPREILYLNQNEKERNEFSKPQHIYILSSEEIKEGDWCLIDNNVGQSKGYQLLQCEKTDINNGWYYFKDFKTGRCKKIIATTDFELRTPDSGMKAGYYMKDSMPLPRPSDDFIKVFVKTQGKIDKILVEYKEYSNQSFNKIIPSRFSYFQEYKLKIAPDNTIIIKPIHRKNFLE